MSARKLPNIDQTHGLAWPSGAAATPGRGAPLAPGRWKKLALSLNAATPRPARNGSPARANATGGPAAELVLPAFLIRAGGAVASGAVRNGPAVAHPFGTTSTCRPSSTSSSAPATATWSCLQLLDAGTMRFLAVADDLAFNRLPRWTETSGARQANCEDGGQYQRNLFDVTTEEELNGLTSAHGTRARRTGPSSSPPCANRVMRFEVVDETEWKLRLNALLAR